MQSAELNDPPAKNLRKNSGRHAFPESNMAVVSENTASASKRRRKSKKEGIQSSTPSVKSWLNEASLVAEQGSAWSEDDEWEDEIGDDSDSRSSRSSTIATHNKQKHSGYEQKDTEYESMSNDDSESSQFDTTEKGK